MANVKLVGNDDHTWDEIITGNYIYAEKYTANATGVLKTIRVYTTAAGSRFTVAIYADNSGYPGSRLSYSGDILETGNGTWQDVVVSDVNITSGTAYWLCVNSSATHIRRIAIASVTKVLSSAYSTFSWPNPMTAGMSDNNLRHIAIAGWGVELSGCPRQAMYLKMLG